MLIRRCTIYDEVRGGATYGAKRVKEGLIAFGLYCMMLYDMQSVGHKSQRGAVPCSSVNFLFFQRVEGQLE